MRTVITSPLLPAIAAAVLAACSDAGGADVGVLVRDSSGVVIVENAAPGWDENDHWIVETEPLLEIGMVEGPNEYQLDRVQSAILLSDGRVAVANGGSQEIRIFSADGSFERALGREGGGPGEFRSLNWIRAVPGDSIIAYDWRDRRITVFARDGGLARTSTLEQDSAQGPPPRVAGWLRDGSVVVLTRAMPAMGEMTGGLTRAPAAVRRVAADGTALNRIADLAGEERMVTIDRERNSISMMILPIFRTSLAVTAGSHVYAADTDRYEVRRYDSDGALLGILRRGHEPTAITEREVAELTARRIEQAETEAQRRVARTAAANLELPPTMPAFAEMLADESGNLWVQEFVWPDGGGRVWSVFNPAGRWLGDVEMPNRLRPTYIDHDHVVGVWTDEMDVQHVRVHRLVGR